MRSLARVERFFERLVERPTARLFGARIQPVQVLRRIERAMESGRRRDGAIDLAPDRFVVRLEPGDLRALGRLDLVAEELASGALAFARAHRLTLLERPTVSMHAASDVRRGDVDVEATISARPAPVAERASDGPSPSLEGMGAATATRVFEAPVIRAPTAYLRIVEPGRGARTTPLDGKPLVIGRGSDAGIVLGDAHVSRHHARLDPKGGMLVLSDLESKNGTRVNGHRVREVVLGAGDRIEIGQTVLTVETPGAGSGV
jgi:Protein of unknown function (DUF3662)/Inner membrane component of T3SS, cytoplasmic domain